MRIEDFVYGKEEIDEPVLIDLINSGEIQRLKGISQFGLPEKYYSRKSYSRYEHSPGVLILLRRLKANLKEQIAGLIHDVSHTAFSHVVDWVIGDPSKEDYQDKIFRNFIENSSIPKILGNCGFDYKEFLNIEQFSLLEQPIPSLCVDRFDYAIREIKDFANADFIIKNLENKNEKLIFKSKNAAEIFARGFARCQKEHWAGDDAKARYYILAEILKEALNYKIISLEDLKKNDEEVLSVLEKSDNQKITYNLKLLKDGFKLEKTKSNKGIILNKKFRYVDPEIFIDNSIEKLSETSQNYKTFLANEKKNSINNFKVNIVRLK